jgi:fumarate reductase flavoprotein subunit
MAQRDFDVIVVGGGGAGLAAALLARRQGASCIILEADRKLGGATALAGGVFYAAGTSVQRAAGIENDTPDAMFKYLMTLNQWALDARLIRTICDNCAPALEWLIEMGADFPPEWLVIGGVDDIPRAHSSRGGGGTVAEALINAAGAAGIESSCNTRVDELIVESGRVVGVRSEGVELRASSVVLTTGGFGNNPAMIDRLYPTAASHGTWTFAVHFAAPFVLGDGIAMAERIGANITGHDTGLLNPTSGFGRFIEAFLPPWIMLVNQRGRRFMAETASYAVSGYLMNEQPNRRAFAIFDESTLVEASQDKTFADPYHSGVPLPTWDQQIITEYVQKGQVKKADTLAEIARHFAIDAVSLQRTTATYNEDARLGKDSVFFKECHKHYPVQTAPFYGVEVRAAIIGLTAAGLEIDAQARVLDAHQEPIPGLYAAGEILGCIHGKRYGGGGMSIGPAITLGRIAGETAAREALAAN